MYGAATMVQASASLAKLVAAVTLHLHPGEVERHALRDGGQVTVVTQSGATQTMTVTADPSVARGTAFVPMSAVASQLIDGGEAITKIRLENAS